MTSRLKMDDDDFYLEHHQETRGRILFEAMMVAGGLRVTYARERRYSSGSDLSPIRKRSISPECRKGEIDVLPCERFQGKRNNYTEIAEKNAQELIEEEEVAKMKAEKKRAKKERQRQKKKEIAESTVKNYSNSDNAINTISKIMENTSLNTDNKEAEGLDVHAAFMSKAIKKVKNSAIISEETKPKKQVKDLNSLITIALDYENKQLYKEAVQYLSEAINLAPRKYDLLLKRSYIYYQLAKFEKSLRDAQKVVQYSPKNADAHFRLGEAYFALNNLPDAETSYTKLLNLNSFCAEAKNRLFSIRIKQLEEMGYHPNEAFTALLKSKNQTLDEAIEYLTGLEDGKEPTEDLYYSDEDESEEEYEEDDCDEEEKTETVRYASLPATGPVEPKITISKKSPLLTDSSNPLGCCSIFVGNLKKDITAQEVRDVFIKFGDIKSIKLVTEPNCYGFVNYEESDSAGRAMEALQGSRWLLSTVPLLIKYPTNVVNNTIPTLKNSNLILSKLKGPPLVKLAAANQCTTEPPASKATTASKPRPPPQTEECFFWRTTGCVYGNQCFNLHIPENRGIDLNIRKHVPF